MSDKICAFCNCPESHHSDTRGCYNHPVCLQFKPVEKEDAVVMAVCHDLQERSKFGIKKYGVTLHDSSLTLEQLLQHQLEELLDAANYTKAALMKLRGEMP